MIGRRNKPLSNRLLFQIKKAFLQRKMEQQGNANRNGNVSEETTPSEDEDDKFGNKKARGDQEDGKSQNNFVTKPVNLSPNLTQVTEVVVPLPPPVLTRNNVTPVLPPFTAGKAQNGGQEKELDYEQAENDALEGQEDFVVSRSQLTDETTRKTELTAKTND